MTTPSLNKMMNDSVFVDIFGKSPRVLVLDFLLDNHIIDFHKSDIAEQTRISRSTLDVYFDDIVEHKLIRKSRIIGRAQMYKVNTDNPVMRQLLLLDRKLSQLQAVTSKANDKKPQRH